MKPARLLGLTLSYWLAIASGWRHDWRSESKPRYWTVTRGGERKVEATFRWSDVWDKPPFIYCQCCARREGQHHSALCPDQNLIHPQGRIVT